LDGNGAAGPMPYENREAKVLRGFADFAYLDQATHTKVDEEARGYFPLVAEERSVSINDLDELTVGPRLQDCLGDSALSGGRVPKQTSCLPRQIGGWSGDQESLRSPPRDSVCRFKSPWRVDIKSEANVFPGIGMTV